MPFRPFFFLAMTLLTTAVVCPGQAPVSVVSHSWTVERRPGVQPVSNAVHPEKELTGEKYADRKRRENQVQGGAVDQGDQTPDARRAELDKIGEESRASKAAEVDGYTYRATVKNDSEKTIRVVYWEYRFAEPTDLEKVIRREFLCSTNIKPGDKRDLFAFSTLAPSDVVKLEDLARAGENRFDEKVVVNRIEYSDDTVLTRGGWKFDDHKKAIDHVTATPWGKEVCRSL